MSLEKKRIKLLSIPNCDVKINTDACISSCEYNVVAPYTNEAHLKSSALNMTVSTGLWRVWGSSGLQRMNEERINHTLQTSFGRPLWLPLEGG